MLCNNRRENPFINAEYGFICIRVEPCNESRETGDDSLAKEQRQFYVQELT